MRLAKHKKQILENVLMIFPPTLLMGFFKLLVTTLMEDSRHAWSHSAGYYLNGGFKVCLESFCWLLP